MDDSTTFDVHKLSAVIFYDTDTGSVVIREKFSSLLLSFYPLIQRLSINDDLGIAITVSVSGVASIRGKT